MKYLYNLYHLVIKNIYYLHTAHFFLSPQQCTLVLLAGYSFGGTVAYEMASELKRKRETVAMVFMVDTYSWFPEGLPHHSAFVEKYAERNLKKMQNPTVNYISLFCIVVFFASSLHHR